MQILQFNLSKELWMYRRTVWAVVACAGLIFALAYPAAAQNIDAREYRLSNGMQVLLVEKHEAPTIMGGIFFRVGSANEITGITGISHLFEHMMFKGTKVIGTKDFERERVIMSKLDSLRVLMRAEQRIMRDRLRKGEITDMNDPAAKTERYKGLDKVFDSLVLAERELIIKDQLDEIYSKHGGFFLNAFTSNDMTAYIVRIPKNKIELYAWLESDRLINPVFREFYSERDVVREERRLGTESTPTGLIEEEFNAMFWQASSYRWDIVGWPSDLENITKEQADAYFGTYYAPNNATLILVGDLIPDEIMKLVKKYFERIPRGKTEPPDVITLEQPQHAEKRIIAEAEANPQTEIMYHTVAFKHPDNYALDVLAGIMNGKTGRLFKKLVDEKGIALGSGGGGGGFMGGGGLKVNAGQDSRKYAGVFSISAEGKAETNPERLEAAIYEVLDDLQKNPASAEELQKVKNQLRVDKIRFMDIMSGIGILFYLGQNAAMGDWAEANEGPAKIDQVTAADVQRVANTYFGRDQRNVLLINTKAKAEGEGPAEDPQVAQIIQRIKGATDATKLEQMISMFTMQMEQVSEPQEKAAMEKILQAAKDRLAELKAQSK